ncbi:MAG: hypothetical protein GY696_36235 [Gammaproteobacteria bacterium]|nr:hypothetical protein [Gammaproteobacteria bacterium]
MSDDALQFTVSQSTLAAHTLDPRSHQITTKWIRLSENPGPFSACRRTMGLSALTVIPEVMQIIELVSLL